MMELPAYTFADNINNDRVDLEDIVFIDEEADNSMENSRVFTDGVLLNITGASIGRNVQYIEGR